MVAHFGRQRICVLDFLTQTLRSDLLIFDVVFVGDMFHNAAVFGIGIDHWKFFPPSFKYFPE